MNEMRIRPYRNSDREAVREIAWQTAFMGRPASAFFSDKELLNDFLTLYFTDYEPALCFVAESGAGVGGYIIGARDERRIAEVAGRAMAFRLLPRLLVSILSARNLHFFLRLALSGLRGEFRGEDFYREYPAVLHINLAEGCRGQGTGRRLIAAYEDCLRRSAVPGVHLATMSPGAGLFFEKQGFVPLARKKRSYFRHITGGDIEVGIYGKRLV